MGATPAIGAAGNMVSFEFGDLDATSLEPVTGDLGTTSLEPVTGDLDATSLEPVTTASSSGTATVTTRVVTRDGGQAFAAEGRSGTALRLPAYVASTTEPRAVLRITDDTGADSLSPGTRDFAFGATARLDAESQGAITTDNGNNLVQRGLASDVAQYKLDLDARFPQCTVKGSLGKVGVRIREAVSPDDWYTLMCTRVDSTVTLTVDRHHADGTTTRRVKSLTGLIGTVTMASPTIPMSVGGKLGATGTIVSSSDQFNGVVDDVYLRITS
jgi:hypothetical protein